MSKSIFNLVGTTIQKVDRVEDYFQLIMDTEIMNIFNPVTSYTSNDINNIELINAIKKKIVNIEYETRMFLKIKLEDDTYIEISFLEEDYTGPEAINVYFGSGEVIVFE